MSRVVGCPMMFTDGCSMARINARGHLVASLVEVRVHGRDQHVEGLEEVVVPVERAVGLDVELRSVQQGGRAVLANSCSRSAAGGRVPSVMRSM